MKRIFASSLLVLAAGAAAIVPAGAGAITPVNRIDIVSSSAVRSRAVYDITLRGFARRRATAHLFVDYAGCADSFAAEARRAANASYSYGVRGGFAEVSGWKSSAPGTDHACAYLISRSGALLASDRIAFPIR